MMAMLRPLVVVAVLAALFHCNVAQQVQMPEAGALHLLDEDLSSQVLTLQRNISELWTYIYQLRTAVSQHLNHLRQHQVELEDVVHKMSHYHEGQGEGASAAHTDGHHHSGEQHSHSNEQHSHSGEHHSHGDSHSHSGEHHSHGDDHHSHSGEHSHGSDDHSHGGDDHSHGSHGHYHDSHSHSHSHDSHGSHSSHEEGDSHHHHDHKDSHEKEDDLQQTVQGEDLQQVPQGPGPVAEPVIVPSVVRSHNSHVHTSSSNLKPLPLMNNYHHHHHHHDQEPRRNRSRVVVMPKYSEYDLYEFAVCNMQPNRAIPVEQQQEITGQVTLWQRKTGGALNLHVRLQGFDMGDHHGHHQQTVQQEDDNETPSAVVHKHGFHVHASGDFSNGCQSAGSHYNPKNANHGGPNSLVRHVGDLGNIECDDHGVANIVFSDDVASLKGPYSIVGRAIVVHSQPDDLGLGGDEESLRTGNAGARLACCVIEKVDKLPIRSYKAIKTAKQYQN